MPKFCILIYAVNKRFCVGGAAQRQAARALIRGAMSGALLVSNSGGAATAQNGAFVRPT